MAHFKKAAQSRKVPQPLPKAPSLLPIGGSLPKVHTWLQHEAALDMEGGTIQLRSFSSEKMPQKNSRIDALQHRSHKPVVVT
jgi:hypothetical protein